MSLVTALMCWSIVIIWSSVLATVVVFYWRNPRASVTTRLLLGVLAIETVRNVGENTYAALSFGGQFGLLPGALAEALAHPVLLFLPKLFNVAAGCLVLTILLLRWLPAATREWQQSERDAAELRRLATHDETTGLVNRRHFSQLAETEWQRSRRYDRPLSLLVCEFAFLAVLVDRDGRDVGDLLLRLADACRECTRSSDVVARLDREKFAVLLPETRSEGARLFAERLRRAVLALGLPDTGENVAATLSIGIAEATWNGSVPKLMKQAELALDAAKQSERDRICLFNPAASWTAEAVE